MGEEKISSQDIWTQALELLKEELSSNEFETWIARIHLGSIEGKKATLYVPSAFFKDRFELTYSEKMEKALSKAASAAISVVLEVKKDIQKAAQPSAPKVTAAPVQKPAKEKKSSNDYMLNPAYVFDSFIPGENSNFAYSAAMAIAKNPGSVYNPCLIYGGVGLGKTHLLQSIGNYIQKNSNLKIMYVTAENFTNDFIQSINEKTQRQFQKKYRSVAVLLMDDIQFLQQKEGIQSELFNTFNDLYDTGRQIVFTSDRPVEELRGISDRLRSRFSRGLCIDIQPPDFETRVAILNAKCNEKNFSMSSDVIEYIARNISSNVRALESCVTKLMAYSQLLNKDISLETAKEQLKQIINSNNDSSGISIAMIIKCVAAYYNVSPYDIKGKSRGQSVIIPRQVAMYLCRSMTDFSTTEIASEFGGKNHTTVIYNVQKINALMQLEDSEMRVIINKLTNQIKQESRKN